MDELTLDDEIYISSKKAAKITGYARDYVGQLCREGHVTARLVGRNWYVLEASIREHRFGPDIKASKKEESKPEATISAVSGWERPKYVAEEHFDMASIGKKGSSINVFDTSRSPEIVQSRAQGALLSEDPVAQMQSAWQDWFSRKNELQKDVQESEILLETPEIIERREEDTKKSVRDVLESFHQSASESITTQEEAAEPVKFEKITEQSLEPVPLRRNYSVRSVKSPIVPQKDSPERAGRVVYERIVKKPASTRRDTARKRAHIKSQKPNFALQAVFVLVALISIGVAFIGSGNLTGSLSQSASAYPPIRYLVGESIVNKSNK